MASKPTGKNSWIEFIRQKNRIYSQSLKNCPILIRRIVYTFKKKKKNPGWIRNKWNRSKLEYSKRITRLISIGTNPIRFLTSNRTTNTVLALLPPDWAIKIKFYHPLGGVARCSRIRLHSTPNGYMFEQVSQGQQVLFGELNLLCPCC